MTEESLSTQHPRSSSPRGLSRGWNGRSSARRRDGCAERRRGRSGFLAWLPPRGSEHRQQEVVEADVASVLPGQDEQEAKDDQDRVGAGGACEQEGEVHQQSARGRQADECAQDQSNTYCQLTEDDDVAE